MCIVEKASDLMFAGLTGGKSRAPGSAAGVSTWDSSESTAGTTDHTADDGKKGLMQKLKEKV